jgi:Tfp pilus assembly protein PilW
VTAEPTNPERGVTVVEMVVVVALLSLVLGFVLQAFSSVQLAESRNELRQQTIDNAQVGMAVTTKDLRATAWDGSALATRFVSATGTAATFYASLNTTTNSNGCADLVTVALNTATGVMTEAVTVPTADAQVPTQCDYAAAPTSTRQLATGVQNSGLLFQYFGNPLNGSPALNSQASPTVAATDLGTITSATITMVVAAPTNSQVGPTSVTEHVRFAAPTDNFIKS